MEDLSGINMDSLNDIAYGLVTLCIIMFVVLGVVGIILRFVPIPKGLKEFILGLSSLAAMYIWFKITFM